MKDHFGGGGGGGVGEGGEVKYYKPKYFSRSSNSAKSIYFRKIDTNLICICIRSAEKSRLKGEKRRS